MKRIHHRLAAVTIVLGVGALAGCSGQPVVAPKPSASTTQQSKPSEPGASTPTAPAGLRSEPAGAETLTGQPGGEAHAYCARVETDGDVISTIDDNASAFSDADKTRIKERLSGLASAAPGEVKPAMETIATGYGKLLDGKITAGDQVEAGEIAAAVVKFGEWMTKNCAT